MAIGSKSRKNAIRVIIGLILLADIGLVFVNWKLSSEQGSPGDELRALRIRRDLMTADVRRAEAIRASLPGVQTETASFMEKDLRPTAAWASTIKGDLDALAKDSGLQLTTEHFKQKAIDKRGVDEITISVTLQGAYPSLVSFINSLERSKNFYLLDSLTLDNGTEGVLKLNLELRTYFRS